MATKGVQLASAYIALSVETSQVPTQVRKALEGVDKYGATAGRDIGRRMGDALSGEVGRAGRDAGEGFSSNFRRETSNTGRQAAATIDGDLVQGADRSGRTAGKRFADKFESSADPKVSIDASGAGRDAGSDAGGSFVSGFGGGIAALGTRSGPIAGAIVAGGLAGIKVLGPQIRAAMEQEVSRDLVQARLGIDEATTGRIASASAKAFANNFGASLQANQDTAVAAFESGLLSMNADTTATRRVIEQLSTVSTLLGEDIPTVARAASQAIRTGIATDATGAFDLLVKGQQAGLNVSQDMLDTIVEYGTQARKFGLSGAEWMGLLSQAVKGGARDTDVAADALKEFSIRVVDGSETTTEAFTALGLDADVMASKFAAGGTSARDAFDAVVDKIRGIQDPVAQSRIAVQLFGTQAEDLGSAIKKFDLSTAVNEFGKVENASQNAADQMTSNVANEWELAKRNLIAKANEIRAAWNMDEWFSSIPKAINDWFDPDPTLTPGAPGVPFTPGQTTPPGSGAPGQNPLDVISGGLNPGAAGLKSRYEGMGFGNIGGFSGTVDQPWDEHQTGNAIDVMIPNWQGAGVGTGQGVVTDALRQPGTQHVIWRQKIYYPDGRVEDMEDRGSPTENHMDHVHILTRRSGGSVSGPGSGTSDSIPAYLSNGEHVLTAAEVAMMGGQSGVYAFRDALHRAKGGDIFRDKVRKSDKNQTPPWLPGTRQPYGPEWEPGLQPGYRPGPGGPYADKGFSWPWWMFPGPGGRLPAGSRERSNKRGIFGLAGGGAVDPLLEMLRLQGVDPATLQHGTGQGMLPGPTPEQLAQMGIPGGDGAQLPDMFRSQGYIPAGAGFTGKTTGGLAGGLINMGAEAINGLIDQAAGAASMGANVAAPGSGMAIGMAAQAAKRAVQWGAEMAGIGIGAVGEILLPFGAPRWLTDVDPTSFMPQMGVQPAAVTSGEIALQETISAQHGLTPGAPPGPPVPGAPPPAPGTPPGLAPVGPPVGPNMSQPSTPPQPPIPPPPQQDPNNPLKLWNLFGFDNGGILEPGSVGLNLSNRPEPVLTPKQWKTMESNAANGAAGGITYNITATGFSPDEVARDIVKRQKLAVLQHQGRP